MTIGAFQFTGFGESETGELYLAGGFEVVQLIDPTNGIFADGFESGDVTMWHTCSFDSGVSR